jgi:hypothetical protein
VGAAIPTRQPADLPGRLPPANGVASRRSGNCVQDGRVIDEGSLDELLERCEEMQRLWKGELDDELGGNRG